MYLGTQIIAAFLLVVLMVLIHAVGVVLITKLLRLEDSALRARQLDFRAFGLLTSMALSLFMIHTLEITLFALFYLEVGAIETVEEALYFSASSYATLGHPDIDFPERWRLLGAFEGVAGFLLIGWSTAVFVTDMNKLLRK
jgi:hypothetical protein